MTLQECYAALDGSYEEAAGRLRSDRLVQKFILKFLEDGSYGLLLSSLEEQNYKEAFRAAHTIKGMCQNLSFTRLGDSSSRLSEALRGGWTPEVPVLVEQVRNDYQRTAAAIRSFQEALPG